MDDSCCPQHPQAKVKGVIKEGNLYFKGPGFFTYLSMIGWKNIEINREK